MTLRALWYGCFFRHGNFLRERNDNGVMVLTCDRCNESHVPNLSKDPHQGIAHQRPVILGEPVCKVEKMKIWEPTRPRRSGVLNHFANDSAIARRK